MSTMHTTTISNPATLAGSSSQREGPLSSAYSLSSSSSSALHHPHDIAQDYKCSLMDLTFNSKPIINNLTIIAHENMEFAHIITKVIEEHINKVQRNVSSADFCHFMIIFSI